jgi:hypothetical protein
MDDLSLKDSGQLHRLSERPLMAENGRLPSLHRRQSQILEAATLSALWQKAVIQLRVKRLRYDRQKMCLLNLDLF